MTDATDAPPLSLVVIGHVNHGKTALVRALTGIETDRLKEEIARGLSITLGFAWRAWASARIDFIDAPGHEDFIRAMVMGATGARAALLVVSAVEGFGRQTREHLRIAGLLGLSAGVVAVTKADLLATGSEAAVRDRVTADLAGTCLAGEPVVFCSATTGAGLEALQDQLRALPARSPAPASLSGAYLPLDRVFTIAGSGTVATGTLLGGAFSVGDEAVLQPSGRRVVLRQVQVHGRSAPAAAPGGRVAVGLRGAAAGEVPVGEVLCAPGRYAASSQVDVEIALSPDSARPLKTADEVRVLWGARQDIARARLIGPATIAPGGRGLAQLRFPAPVIAFAGQRGVLRRLSPPETIGGLVVLDAEAPLARGRTDGRRRLLEAVAAEGPERIAAGLAERDGGLLSLAEGARLSRMSAAAFRERLEGPYEPLDEGTMAAAATLADVRAAYLRILAEAHGRAAVTGLRTRLPAGVSPVLTARVERRLAASGEIRLQGGQVSLPAHDPLGALSPAAQARLREIDEALRAGGVSPPEPRTLPGHDGDDPALVALLIEAGRAIPLRNHALKQTLIFHRAALVAAAEALLAAFPPPAAFAAGEAREALATSRKFIVPVLEYFDARGVTVRRDDVRRMSGAENPLGIPPNPL